MIGSTLKKLRNEVGISQGGLGVKLGVSQQAVGQWERDARDPDSEMIKRIANYFDVTTDYLMGNSCAEDNNLLEVMNFKKDELLLFLDKLKNDTRVKRVKWLRWSSVSEYADDEMDATNSFVCNTSTGNVQLIFLKEKKVKLYIQFDKNDDGTTQKIPYDPDLQKSINELYNFVYTMLPNIENFLSGYLSQES